MDTGRGKLFPRDEPSTRRAAGVTPPSNTAHSRARGAEGTTPRTSERLLRLGRYEVLFELARGGMGTIYVGRLLGAHGVDRLVAIKRLSASTNDADLAAFLGEARLTARINHPNVVQTFELVESDSGPPFLVMQLVEGVSLALLMNRLSERGRAVEPDLAAWIVANVASGLHAAHELTRVDGTPLGIVHRDVSPQNVLLSFDGRPYVTDFGVAKLHDAERATESGVVKGKFAYMSPEQARAQAVDRRSDVFSLGIVLYEALTCERLFGGGAPAETILKILEHSPPSPKKVRGEIPDALVPIVMRCLEKRPDARYASAADLADALRAYLRGRGARVDETDLSKLLLDTCQTERARIQNETRAAILRASEDAPSEDIVRDTVPEPERGPMHANTVTAAISAAAIRRPRTRLLMIVATIAGFAATFGAIAWFKMREPSSASTSTPPSSSSAIPIESPAPPPPPTATTTTPATASTASTTPAPPPTSTLTASSRLHPPSRPPPPPPPRPPPTASAGAPFRSLD